jgi:hypothetical protein
MQGHMNESYADQHMDDEFVIHRFAALVCRVATQRCAQWQAALRP